MFRRIGLGILYGFCVIPTILLMGFLTLIEKLESNQEDIETLISCETCDKSIPEVEERHELKKRIIPKNSIRLVRTIGIDVKGRQHCYHCGKTIKGTSIHEYRQHLHPDNGRAWGKGWSWFCSYECSNAYMISKDFARKHANEYGYLPENEVIHA